MSTETTQTDTQDVVYVACQAKERGADEVVLELRETNDDELAVMVYSSLETLVSACGEAQPWVAVPREEIDELVERSGADGVLLDTVIPQEMRHTSEEGDGRE